ncbi:MAG TPA: hypothetical protein VK569_03215 [Bacteroidota bacterium]|nr:hypothetical protein [Bacteroidota bacterium]
MRCTLRVILLSALLTPDPSHCQDRTLFVSPLISYDTFQTPGFANGIDLGAGAGLRISRSLALSATVTFGQRSQTFDLIGESQDVNARIVSLAGSFEILFLGNPGSAALAATLGAGRVSSTVDAQTISLGALGSLTIPARSSARGFLQAGLAGELPISADLFVVILPSARFYTAPSTSADFSLAGGLRVGIL